MQLPHVVSLGAQKNFINFSLKLHERGKFEPDIKYFEHLIAKAILFKTAERLIGGMNFGGYRANIVTYTLSWLSHHSQQRIDLDEIWKMQELPSVLLEAIRTVSGEVHKVITNPPNGRNVTEWCKRKECWEAVVNAEVPLDDGFFKSLRNTHGSSAGVDKGIDTPGEEESELMPAVYFAPVKP